MKYTICVTLLDTRDDGKEIQTSCPFKDFACGKAELEKKKNTTTTVRPNRIIK